MLRIFLLSFALILLKLSYAADIDWQRTPDLDELSAVVFKPVEQKIVEHKFERRGFVEVPFDYHRPEGPWLKIFYRLIPSLNLRADDTLVPIMVVVNGGPGLQSGLYQNYELDYTNDEEVLKSRLYQLRKNFRILILDQRGTNGYSAPLDLLDPHINPNIIARYFDSDEHAWDHHAVIQAVIPSDQDFYMIAQSYGGQIGMHYMLLDGINRFPKALIFSSSLLPHMDSITPLVARRESQKALNLRLKSQCPEIELKLQKLRNHFAKHSFDENSVNYLWKNLGKGANWENEINDEIEDLLGADQKALHDFLADSSHGVDLLNYILSSAAVSPGYTDRGMAQEVMAQTSFDPWMIDELWTLVQIGTDKDAPWLKPLIKSIDNNPPPKVNYPLIEEMKSKLRQTKILYTVASNDAYLELSNLTQHITKFLDPPYSQIRTLPGGHPAIFSKDGSATILDFIGRKD